MNGEYFYVSRGTQVLRNGQFFKKLVRQKYFILSLKVTSPFHKNVNQSKNVNFTCKRKYFDPVNTGILRQCSGLFKFGKQNSNIPQCPIPLCWK